jgi:heptose I phosphotransferase
LTSPFARCGRGRIPSSPSRPSPARSFANSRRAAPCAREVAGRGYFVKIHRGVGWAEIVKNLLSLRLPVLGAANEWRAIQRLSELGVDSMHAVAYGLRGRNPGRQHSFIITEELSSDAQSRRLLSGTGKSIPRRYA